MTRHIVTDCAFKVISEAKVREMMANGVEAFIMRGGYVTGVDPETAPQAQILINSKQFKQSPVHY